MIVQLLILAALLLLVPAVVGGIAAGVEKHLFFRWVGGQMILWAGFQVICVPMILAQRDFQDVKFLFSGFMAVMVLVAVALDIRRRTGLFSRKSLPRMHGEKDTAALLLWVCVFALLLLQLVLTCALAYEEGDDAFYVSISTLAEYSGRMYEHLPYTGGGTGLDARHALAPMPIWVAYMAGISGMRTVTTAQVALPVVLIMMSYAIYYLLGRRLFPEGRRKLPLFLLLLQLLVLFGGYSTYSAENFLLVRTAQGKSVMANIVIPFLFFVFLSILEQLQAEDRTDSRAWLMVGVTMIAGCLCSTQGTLLTCMLLGIVGSCMVVCYRRWKLFLPMIGCGMIPACMAFAYFWLE